jgi:hypothetical protein
MQKPDFGNAASEGSDVTEVLAMSSANPNGGYWNGFVHVVPRWTNGIRDGRILFGGLQAKA